MGKKIARLLPSTNELLRQLGVRLRLARLRRRLSAKQVAERAGMSPMTLRSLERGGSGVTVGAYLAVMQVLGIERDLDLLAQADPVGRELQDAQLPTHRKTTVRNQLSLARSPTPSKRAAVNDSSAQLDRLIQDSPQQRLRKLFESLPSEQIRKALEALPETQIRKALAALPTEQLRRLLDQLDAPARTIDKLLGSSEDEQGWIAKSGFASSKTLTDLIDPIPPPPKKST